jgi:hypothetical protein
MGKLSPELWLVLIPAYSWLLFALGGTQISDTIEGQKWLRRFVLTFLWGLCAFLGGFHWYQAVGVFVLGTVMLHMGYGSRTSWPMRILVFAGYGIISAPIGLSFWNIATALICPLMFYLSNQKWATKTFVWKVCEGTFGALIGITIAFALTGYGLIW